MAKNEQNITASKEFIRDVLMKNFSQKVDDETLSAAAERLCAAIPEERVTTERERVAA